MKTIDRTLLILGGLLLVTVLLPVEDGTGRPVALSALPGVAPFSTLLQAIYPGLLGLLLLLLARSRENSTGKGIAALLGFLLPITVLDENPIARLAYLGAWESASGHQVLLLLGVVLAAGGCHLVGLGGNRSVGSLIASMGVALMAAYHLAPLPNGTVPIIAHFLELSGAWSGGGLGLLTAVFNLALGLLQLIVSALALLSLRMDRRDPGNAGAGIVAWAISGLIPAVALPIVVKAGLVAGGGDDVQLLLRYLILLTALLVGMPLALAALGLGLSQPNPPGGAMWGGADALDSTHLNDSGPTESPPLE